jgi:hypothetical protein
MSRHPADLAGYREPAAAPCCLPCLLADVAMRDLARPVSLLGDGSADGPSEAMIRRAVSIGRRGLRVVR